MYKVILKKGYDSLEFSFGNYIDASAFIEMVLGSGEDGININVKYEDKNEGREGEE